ncbi:hypothetical protein M569_10665, partial [Genlisea aurea]
HDRRTYFPRYWSSEAVNDALKKGELFKASFCVNAYNRFEAYGRIDGLQTDVLIDGLIAQNRAVEGDTVVIAVDPPSLWPRMKGSYGSASCSSSKSDHHEALTRTQNSSGAKSKQEEEYEHAVSRISSEDGPDDGNGGGSSFEKLCSLVNLYPSKRPTGSVVAVVEKSHRRDRVVGFLCVKQYLLNRGTKKKNSRKNKIQSLKNDGFVLLAPVDPKFTKMMIPVEGLPVEVMKRLEDGDPTIESDLVAAKIVDWIEECHIPIASLVTVFGKGSDIQPQIAAILFENGINTSGFSPQVLACVPQVPWKVPQEEAESRTDLREVCIFTIDPASATDLDDALSVETLPDGHFRVGVHIADASYFVLPDTAVDIDARIRSTSVYLLRSKLSMLPPMLSDDVASLIPGESRLAVSILFDISAGGEILDHWIGRTVIRSCCKLSYESAEDIIEGRYDSHDSIAAAEDRPALYGKFEWSDVISSVRSLHEISTILRDNRYRSGAVSIETSKVAFLFDDQGFPYDTFFRERTNSDSLVEEFMLLANRTVAEVITRAYPSRALLRRHSEPNTRKLREFESFCSKHGLEAADFSSSARLHRWLECIRSEVSDDPVFCAILTSCAAKSMQLSSYVCSGDYEDSGDLKHYALGVPLYTHFTSPLRRYADILVHRTLAAVLEAEDTCTKTKNSRCCRLTGSHFDRGEVESAEAQEALSAAASKHELPSREILASAASHCNVMNLAARRVEDSTGKLYVWDLVRKKQVVHFEARVTAIGPKFMSVYIPKLAMERRIHYDEVEGLSAAWLEATSTLVLSVSSERRRRQQQQQQQQQRKKLDDVVLVAFPSDDDGVVSVESAFFPMTVRVSSTIPVAVHAVGGDDGPIDIVARLFCCSYL